MDMEQIKRVIQFELYLYRFCLDHNILNISPFEHKIMKIPGEALQDV